MKAVLISIRKHNNDKIFAGQKRFEGRKRIPKEMPIKNWIDPTTPYNAADSDTTFYIYEPQSGGGSGKVVGEFKCDFAQSFRRILAAFDVIAKDLCVSIDFAEAYFNKSIGYMLRICEPKKYDEPKELIEFRKEKINCLGMPCQCCKFYNEEKDGLFACDNILTRPPQSWCYVEELEDKL